jgi:hypothetical protein
MRGGTESDSESRKNQGLSARGFHLDNSNLTKDNLMESAFSFSMEEERMKLSCSQWCHVQEVLANLKCPNCFSAKVKLCEEKEKNAECQECQCRFDFDPEILGNRWE